MKSAVCVMRHQASHGLYFYKIHTKALGGCKALSLPQCDPSSSGQVRCASMCALIALTCIVQQGAPVVHVRLIIPVDGVRGVQVLRAPCQVG